MGTKRVLIIDDEPGIRQIVQISLKAIAGWDVLLAASGKEGITVARVEVPDAILLDVMMPEMDGISTFQQMQTYSELHSIPTILLTAKAQTIEQRQFSELGVTGVITKPFKAPDLVKQMRSLLNW
ncbi:response regulator [Anabaena cylindrica FACHB-243]|uniref:Response regulator receiver protein n=1 Tax=Anabaena cylindrica (strain ATCC 27899 / PCC 7122) TaxID=272123 RepID=K9ZNL0_ANACC|nr:MULTISPECIES: response regulator [Anabaena]AFZ59915.1 response regulator receiver protein [Anabaena cylindrica PCC 7122]MBD2416744.1 response regulator [Anabaena cylindrica FACHB-243]MBY5282439.1 response regulator [Anabaena sp. CCAP 1446/1C]MBY5311021.1 response regulator [Anabaena sp. CCAP 1446/1C]MCM2409835.1 response regulator [Anabaena sp. CCAP 1446/1C]